MRSQRAAKWSGPPILRIALKLIAQHSTQHIAPKRKIEVPGQHPQGKPGLPPVAPPLHGAERNHQGPDGHTNPRGLRSACAWAQSQSGIQPIPAPPVPRALHHWCWNLCPQRRLPGGNWGPRLRSANQTGRQSTLHSDLFAGDTNFAGLRPFTLQLLTSKGAASSDKKCSPGGKREICC